MSAKRSTNPGEGSSSGHAKRVRFGRENDDSPQSLEEVDDSDLLEKRKRRRGAVKLGGYLEGDTSSEDEEGPRGDANGKKKRQEKDQDEDDDMFGDSSGNSSKKKRDEDDEEDDATTGQHEYADFVEKDKIARWKDKKGRDAGVGFDQAEIEGEASIQEADQEYDSEGNPTIEAFNMRTELEDEGGHIDRDGNFVRAKVDPDRFHDNWLEGISRKEMAAAKDAEERKRQRQRILDREEEAASASMTKEDIYLELVNLLQPSETVLEAIQRLGGGKAVKGAHATKKKGWQKAKKPSASDKTGSGGGSGAEDTAAMAENKRLIEKLTDLSDKMMGMGHFDIYEQTYERIVRELRRADLIADDWVVGTPVLKPGENVAMLLDDLDDPLFGTAVSWEYKWANPALGEEPQQGGAQGEELQQGGAQGEEPQVFGPFTGPQMTEWRDQGFFKQGILVRRVGDKTFEPGDKVQFE